MNQKYSKRNKKSNQELILKLKAYLRKNSAEFLAEKNISSIGIGLKRTGAEQITTNEICIQFTVDQKIRTDVLESTGQYQIPSTIKIEDGLEITTDVLERKYELSFSLIEEAVDTVRKTRHDPLFPGISISNAKGTAGTLGCIVYDIDDGTPFILSNWHVLHGDDGIVGDNIVQPGPHDDNRISLNSSGTLVRSHLGEAGDCAISTIENRSFQDQILELGTNVKQLCEPELLDKVIKSGRTTALTIGIVERIHVVTRIYYGPRNGYKNIGCFEIGIDPDNQPPDGEISKPGDSGACWLIYENNNGNTTGQSGIMAGLHFAGESSNDPHERALACYAKPVFEKLGIQPSKVDNIEKKTTGYNKNFLNTKVEVPTLDNRAIAYELDGSECIDYTHFSLALHKERRFAIWVAWNIDGKKIQKLSRQGLDFKYDPRIPTDYQIGNWLYKNNNLDRGHVARRADLVWGSNQAASRANKDSFFYTNSVPQINTFNQSTRQGVWGKLEDAIFADIKVDRVRVSVIAGPIFQQSDRYYRDVQIPKEFYKVLCYEVQGVFKIKAFILTQNINRIEIFELDEFETYEVSLTELEERCHFRFATNLHTAQIENSLESMENRQPIYSVAEIEWLA